MENYNDFCKNIINIRNIDMSYQIKQIVKEEKENLLAKTDDLTGYCKYIASLIEQRLKNISVRTYWIDLNNLIHIDHVVLIAEYKYNNEIKRVLIDPTYIQYTKKENTKLFKFQEWPSEMLDKKILKEILLTGTIEINDYIFNNYLSAFGQNVNLSLDELLLNYQTENIIRKK